MSHTFTRPPERRRNEKSAACTRRSAWEAVALGIVATLLLCTAGWWMTNNCRKADRLVAEYGMKLSAQQNAAAELENFLASR